LLPGSVIPAAIARKCCDLCHKIVTVLLPFVDRDGGGRRSREALLPYGGCCDNIPARIPARRASTGEAIRGFQKKKKKLAIRSRIQ
jgi:hypothetical protein